jgi:peptidoglycan/LPS O-acetylase OafA/YrhL
VKQIAAIQVLRAIAAFSVVIGHTQRNAILIAAANHREFHPILLDLTEAGVDLFFVISGFVMVYASRELFAAPGGGVFFLSRRLARIVPLYWSMTTIFLTVMLLSSKLIPAARPELTEILASYFFIPYYRPDEHWMRPVYSVGWTLNYEMFFYAVFACVIALPVKRALTALTLLFCALAIAGVILRPAPGVFFFWSRPVILEFVMGAWIGYFCLTEFRTTNRAASILAIAGIAGFALQVMSGVYAHGYWRPLVWGLPAAAIVAAATLSNWNITSRGLWKPLVLLGSASYSLYLVHPMAVHAMHLLWDKLGLSAHASDTVFFFVTLAPIPLLAIAIYLCFEKPVTKALQVPLRNWFAALRPLSLGLTCPEGASKYWHLTRMRVAHEYAAKTVALISRKPEGAVPAATLLNTNDRGQANGGDNRHFPEKWAWVFRKEMRHTSNLQRFPTSTDAMAARPKLKALQAAEASLGQPSLRVLREHHRSDDGALT